MEPFSGSLREEWSRLHGYSKTSQPCVSQGRHQSTPAPTGAGWACLVQNVQYGLWDPADSIMKPVVFSGRKGLLLTSCSNLGRNIVARYTVVLLASQLPGLQVWEEGNRSTKRTTSRVSSRLCLSLMPDPIISLGIALDIPNLWATWKNHL